MKYETLPQVILELVNPGFSTDERFKEVGIIYPYNVEIDLAKLARLDDYLVKKAIDYYDKTSNFYNDLVSNKCDISAVETSRVISYKKQLDTNQERSDLVDEYESLIMLPIYGELIKKALKKEANWEEITSELISLGGRISRDGLNTTIEFSTPSRTNWNDALGGEYSRGEVRREFKIEISHAKWRDRRVRRIKSILVKAIEIWPEI